MGFAGCRDVHFAPPDAVDSIQPDPDRVGWNDLTVVYSFEE
jgi:hypothetical protein